MKRFYEEDPSDYTDVVFVGNNSKRWYGKRSAVRTDTITFLGQTNEMAKRWSLGGLSTRQKFGMLLFQKLLHQFYRLNAPERGEKLVLVLVVPVI